MGTEFFDGLGETLSRTAKELGERAEQLYGVQKIRNKISGEERIVEKVMTDIGNLIYKRHEEGEALDGELSVLCEEIHQHMMKIREYKGEAAAIRGQKICPSCEKAVDKDVSFCPYCGAECPEEEKKQDDGLKVTCDEDFQQEEPGEAGQTEVQEESACGSCGQEESCTEEQPLEKESE